MHAIPRGTLSVSNTNGKPLPMPCAAPHHIPHCPSLPKVHQPPPWLSVHPHPTHKLSPQNTRAVPVVPCKTAESIHKPSTTGACYDTSSCVKNSLMFSSPPRIMNSNVTVGQRGRARFRTANQRCTTCPHVYARLQMARNAISGIRKRVFWWVGNTCVAAEMVNRRPFEVVIQWACCVRSAFTQKQNLRQANVLIRSKANNCDAVQSNGNAHHAVNHAEDAVPQMYQRF